MNSEQLADRLLDFSVRVGRAVDALPDTRLGRHVAGQLVKCGKSPNANYEEACAAESRKDFIHKVGICLKEMRESKGWLKLIVRAELLPGARMELLLDESVQLCNILAQSII